MEDKDVVKLIKGKIEMPYFWSYGENYSNFFKQIKENKKIYGAKCPECRRVLVPPSKICTTCFVETGDWVEVQDEGVVHSFSIIHLPFPGQPTEPPYSFSYIVLDGSNTAIVHIIKEIDLNKIKVGMRVKAVWSEKREGKWSDIMYFKPYNVKKEFEHKQERIKIKKEKLSYVYKGKIECPHTWTTGDVVSKFLTELKNKKIFGIRCPKCTKIYVPPKEVCGECFVRLKEFIEVKDEGKLLSFTKTNISFSLQPRNSPYIIGMINLKGTNTALLHLVDEIDEKNLRIGMKMKAVWQEQRKGEILDIKYFKPIE